MCLKDADRMAKSVDPDQTAPSLIWFYTAQTCLLENRVIPVIQQYFQVKVVSAKVDFSNVSSKVGSKDKIDHKPKGGDKKVRKMLSLYHRKLILMH